MLQQQHMLDFDDLLLSCIRLLEAHPAAAADIEHVLIDEFQDTNHLQYRMACLLAHRGNITVVGDPDQSIYRFWARAFCPSVAATHKLLSPPPSPPLPPFRRFLQLATGGGTQL